MSAVDEKILSGVAALLLVLVVGAVFGRLHGSDGASVKPLGDRVACGLLSLPLITVAVLLAFPSSGLGWAIAAPAPMALYVALLVGVDAGWNIAKRHFTATLFFGSLAIYLVMAVLAWVGRT